MALRRHHRQPGLFQAALDERDPVLMPQPLGLALLQVAHRGERARHQRRRQRRREDETRRVAAQEIDQRGRAGDIAAHHAERLRQRALDHRRALGHAVALGDAAAARPVEADRVHLVEIGHRAVAVGDVAQFADRRDVAVHRIDRFEAHQLRPLARQGGQTALQILGVVMAENLLLGAAVADAGDHRGVVQRVRQHHHAGDFLRQRRQRRLVRDIARGEDQRRLAPVQIGQLAFELEVQVPVAGDVACAAGAGAERLDRPGHRRQHAGCWPMPR